jgi:hypothetical protein
MFSTYWGVLSSHHCSCSLEFVENLQVNKENKIIFPHLWRKNIFHTYPLVKFSLDVNQNGYLTYCSGIYCYDCLDYYHAPSFFFLTVNLDKYCNKILHFIYLHRPLISGTHKIKTQFLHTCIYKELWHKLKERKI